MLTRPSSLTSPIVTITVGEEQRTFAAHEDILSMSPWFRVALKDIIPEDGAKQLTLGLTIQDTSTCTVAVLAKCGSSQ